MTSFPRILTKHESFLRVIASCFRELPLIGLVTQTVLPSIAEYYYLLPCPALPCRPVVVKKKKNSHPCGRGNWPGRPGPFLPNRGLDTVAGPARRALFIHGHSELLAAAGDHTDQTSRVTRQDQTNQPTKPSSSLAGRLAGVLPFMPPGGARGSSGAREGSPVTAAGSGGIPPHDKKAKQERSRLLPGRSKRARAGVYEYLYRRCRCCCTARALSLIN